MISLWLFSGLLFVVAVVYSAMGLGGASSYTALMAVIFGALLGSHLGSAKLKRGVMEKWLGSIVLIAIILLVKRIITGYYL